MKNKSIKINVMLNFIKTFSILFFPLVTFPYISRILGPEGFGKISFSQSFVSYFTIIALLGVGTYGVREAAKLRNEKKLLETFSQEMIIINFISTVFAYILLFLITFLFGNFYNYRFLIIIFSFNILLSVIGMDWLYMAEEDFLFITIRTVLFQILSIFLVFLFVKEKTDYNKYAIILVVSSCGNNIINFLYARKYINLFKIQKLNIKKHLKPMFILVSLALASCVYTLIDTTMLGLICNDYQVGVYAAANRINRLVISVIITIGSVLLPRLSVYLGEKRLVEYTVLVNKAFDLLLMLAFPCFIGLFIVSKEVIILFCGIEYIEAVPIMKLMSILIPIVTIGNSIQTQIILPYSKEKLNLYAIVTGAMLNLSLNFFLISIFQAQGAAVASVIAEFIVTLLSFVWAKKLISFKTIIINSFLRYLIYSCIMGAVLFYINRFIETGFKKLVVDIVVGMLVYIIQLFIFGSDTVRNLIREKKRRENESVI